MSAPVQRAGQACRRRALLAAPASGRRAAIALQLRGAGYAVAMASTDEEAARCLAAGTPAIAVCDWGVGASAAGGVIRAIRESGGADDYCYVLAIVPAGAPDAASAALAAGADDVLDSSVLSTELRCRLAAGERLLAMAERLTASKREAEDALARLQAMQAATDADLVKARRLQQGLLGPPHRRIGVVDLSLLFRPAGHIGGDLVGFFPINARRVALYAIDVCGTGVTAALLTSHLAAHLASSAGENIVLRTDEHGLLEARSPAQVARLFNRLMFDDLGSDVYFTMVYADLDVVSGAGRLVQAGHPHPLLQDLDGNIDVLGKGGLPIGLIDEADWDEVEFTLEPGARLFIGSDGITEATNPHGTLLGEEGLTAILRTNVRVSGASLLESLCWSVAQFTQGLRTDDISGILIERDAGS